VQSENKFDQLSKRLAVAVSRRSLLRSLSVGCIGVLWPWKKALADIKFFTSADLETKFFAAPSIVELRLAGKIEFRCVAAVAKKDGGTPVVGVTSSRDGECPADIPSYYENTDLPPGTQKASLFDKSKLYDSRVIEGRTYLLKTRPVANFYSTINPATGKEEFEAFCTINTYLDPRVHKNLADRKVLFYKRNPVPRQLTSLADDVTCGGINEAYENEIKTKKPIALRDFADGGVPHASSSVRLNATSTNDENRSGHKSK
jgi:hypothetical protein